MEKLKSFFAHRIFRRYVWFYLAILITAGIAFWAGIQYSHFTQDANAALSTVLDTKLPEWLDSIERHPKKKAMGDPDAPVKVVEYMDTECPYCQQYAFKIFPKLVENYVKNGKIYYVIKHFPLSARVHPNAMTGAIATECASAQGQFWEYKTLAMANRRYQSEKLFLALANLVDIPDQEAFVKCVKKKKPISAVKKEQQSGIDQDVKGTPTVMIEGTTIRGVQRYDKYASAIDAALENGSE